MDETQSKRPGSERAFLLLSVLFLVSAFICGRSLGQARAGEPPAGTVTTGRRDSGIESLQTVEKPAFAASEDCFRERRIRQFLKLLTAKFASPVEMIQNGVFQRPVHS